MTWSFGFNIVFSTILRPLAAPTVIIIFSNVNSVSNLSFKDWAIACRTSSYPALFI